MIAIKQARYEGEGGVYYRKKIAEGKTHREGRCAASNAGSLRRSSIKRLTADSEETMPMVV
jgi:hypothetical protein